MSNWKLTVGLEVHVELETKTKMFCGCPNDPFHSEPNVNVCPVCYGLPGALPLLNKKAIELVVKLGRALNGQIPPTTFWARKNYFYPDLPKGYQISQSTAPLVGRAALTINGQSYAIERIHLEEDAGKLMHEAGTSESLVDFNRAGVPLMELVTEPVFHTPEEAKLFCQELQRIVRSLGISSADMEKGQMRCEANISVSQDEALGTKVEVKNINSFRAVEKAIRYEFDRQVAALEGGEALVQETRTWNDPQGKTISMRGKEGMADYRYFPEPDLPTVSLADLVAEATDHVLPDQQRTQLADIGVPKEMIQPLLDDGLYDRLQSWGTTTGAMVAAVARVWVDLPVTRAFDDQTLAAFINLTIQNGWTKETQIKVAELVHGGMVIEEAARQFSQVEGLADIVNAVIQENAAVVESYRAGKEQAFNFLVGQVMAKAQGRANINTVREELQKALL